MESHRTLGLKETLAGAQRPGHTQVGTYFLTIQTTAHSNTSLGRSSFETTQNTPHSTIYSQVPCLPVPWNSKGSPFRVEIKLMAQVKVQILSPTKCVGLGPVT